MIVNSFNLDEYLESTIKLDLPAQIWNIEMTISALIRTIYKDVAPCFASFLFHCAEELITLLNNLKTIK